MIRNSASVYGFGGFGGFGAPTIPMMVPVCSAVSRQFGGSTRGWRGGVGVGVSVIEAF